MAEAAARRGSTVSAADWWKFTCTALAGVVVTILLGWLSGMSETMTRSQVREMVQTESPYVKDQALIQSQLQTGVLSVEKLATKIDQLIDVTGKANAQLQVLTKQVEQLERNQQVMK
jgi:hypothetical protein